MNGRTLTGLCVALLVGGCSAATQQEQASTPGAPSAGSMEMMAGGEMMPMPGSPEMLLRQRESFGLDPDQVRRLEEIQQRAKEAVQHGMHAGMQKMMEAEATLEGESPDLTRYAAMLREGMEHHVQAHVAMARARVESRAVLTAEQRAKVDAEMRMMGQEEKQKMHEMMHPASAPAAEPRHDH